MSRQIIKLLGVDKSFTSVFDSPTKCDNSVSFRLNHQTLVAKGVASIESQLYKFWEHKLSDDVITKTDNFDKDLIMYLHDAAKFKSTLNYFDSKFDMVITADFDQAYGAYVAKKISVQSPSLTIDFACMEAVLGYTEYTEELKQSKLNMINPGPSFILQSAILNKLSKLCNLGTFNSDDQTLNIDCNGGILRAYNENFTNIVDTAFATDFKRISIKSKFLGVLDANSTWSVTYDTLISGGTKWIFVNADQTITTIIGGLAHDDDNENVNSSEISADFDKEFEQFVQKD